MITIFETLRLIAPKRRPHIHQHKERALRRAILSAQAQCAGVDRRLDGWTDRFHNALLIATNNRRNVADYTRYFGGKPPSVLKRPVLGAQLQTLTGWVTSIKGSSVPQLATTLAFDPLHFGYLPSAFQPCWRMSLRQ